MVRLRQEAGGLIGKTDEETALTGALRLSDLLKDFLLAAVPSEPFGAEGFLRFSFATSQAIIEKGVARLADCASKVR